MNRELGNGKYVIPTHAPTCSSAQKRQTNRWNKKNMNANGRVWRTDDYDNDYLYIHLWSNNCQCFAQFFFPFLLPHSISIPFVFIYAPYKSSNAWIKSKEWIQLCCCCCRCCCRGNNVRSFFFFLRLQRHPRWTNICVAWAMHYCRCCRPFVCLSIRLIFVVRRKLIWNWFFKLEAEGNTSIIASRPLCSTNAQRFHLFSFPSSKTIFVPFQLSVSIKWNFGWLTSIFWPLFYAFYFRFRCLFYSVTVMNAQFRSIRTQ